VGICDIEGSTDGAKAGSCGRCDKHYNPNRKDGVSLKGAPVADTHVDSANPFRFFMGTECSPFSSNGWLFAGLGALLVGAKSAEC
jgi:hypothetical protein